MTENKKALLNESAVPVDIIPQNLRDSFVLYTEQKEVFKTLSDEDAGILIKGIFDYISGQTPELNDLLKLVFIPIRQQLDRNAQKYEAIKEKRRIAGAKGAKQKLANQANANFAKQSLANQADNVNVNVNDNVNVYLSKDKYKKEEIYKEETEHKNKKFIKPTLEEIKAYCLERKNNIDAQTFLDYYESNGFKVGKNPMKDWKATVRNWERNSKQQTNREEQTEYVYNPYA